MNVSISLQSDTLVAMEFVSLLLVSLIFSLLYEMNRKRDPWTGMVASITWFILGAFYFIVYSAYATYIISLLFMLLGVVYFIRFFMGVVGMDDAIQVLERAETM